MVLQEITGSVVVGGELISRFKYSGGEEGASKYSWIRRKVLLSYIASKNK